MYKRLLTPCFQFLKYTHKVELLDPIVILYLIFFFLATAIQVTFSMKYRRKECKVYNTMHLLENFP